MNTCPNSTKISLRFCVINTSNLSPTQLVSKICHQYRCYTSWLQNWIIYLDKSCVDAIEITLTATDDNVVTCKGQGSCQSTSLKLNLRIRETNKPPFCSKTISGTGSSCRDLFELEEDRTLGFIPEYSLSEVSFDEQNKENFTIKWFIIKPFQFDDSSAMTHSL